MTSSCYQLSAQEIVDWVTTAGGCVHAHRRRDSVVYWHKKNCNDSINCSACYLNILYVQPRWQIQNAALPAISRLR